MHKKSKKIADLKVLRTITYNGVTVLFKNSGVLASFFGDLGAQFFF